jgi:serine/threonine protein kinase
MTHQFICSCCKESTDEFAGLKDTSSDVHSINEKSAGGKVARYVVKNFKKLVLSEEFQEVQGRAENRTPMPRLRHSQVELGRMLGEGGFSDVFEVKKFLSTDDDTCSIDADRVAVKVLRRKVTDNISMFAAAAAGLAKEGAILASLSHKNIIQMKSFSHGGLSAYASGRCDAFFIVLDKLHETLKDRIAHWSSIENGLAFSIRHRREKFRSFLRERLLVAAELADALLYLHRNNIIHRDIKPANIGFDADGTLKLFDFDVARILPKESHKDELFHLSLATGTQRYMSPECGLTGKYNLKTDVYSFAILFYEMLSLERPFLAIKKSQHEQVVFRSGLRPRLNEPWPKPIKNILKNSWSADIKSRPSISQVHDVIMQTVEELDRPTSHSKHRLRLPIFKNAPAIGCCEQ